MKMRYVFVMVFINFILMSTIFQQFRINGVMPNFIIIFSIIFAVLYSEQHGYVFAIISGLLQDTFLGKVLFINSLITYAGATPAELQRSFAQEVDDYISDCAELGVEPEKPFSGTFQIRCSPSLHKELTAQALSAGISFNKYVVSVLAGVK